MNSKKNVLLLSAGRRVELLLAIKSEIKERGLNSRVFTTDLNPKMSAACHVADQAFAISRATEDGYMDQLLELCEEQEVGLVIPTIDTELLRLSEHRDRFSAEGIELVISDESLVRVCRDKRLTAQLFNSVGIDVPRILDRKELTFPCFAKPYDGSRSVGAAKLSQAADLSDGMRDDPKMMFMEFIDQSFDEYTVDAYYDRKGVLTCLVPRHRLEVRDGEINKGVTRKHHVYEYLIDKLAKIKGARGCLTVQLFAHPHEKRYAALEINPRFGGGYPLSYSAGANYPGWLIDEYLLTKEIGHFDGWTSDLMMLRYDAHVLVENAH
ncbi:ATP-grasp domain-containing protein [Chlorobium phaeovibrioides]|uniref:ATP-grasp domain-containing protein n=1 Tax=Chlorobium phaeovibrioides TaxID=1094 RepID=A0A3S0L0M0_CHLPH|nr:ATP-grasp domain-containing protein [Chlorobium phaeovibrioides]RTY34905.1 ATP-grasp domain-containing protein [Chlorobium phaeovibrioides]